MSQNSVLANKLARVRRLGLIASGLALTVMVGAVAWAGAELPEGVQVPLHWNIEGVADRFGDRREAMISLIFMPAIALCLSVVFWVTTRVEPLQEGLASSAKALLVGWVASLVLLSVITIGIATQLVGSIGEPPLTSDGFLRLILVATSAMMLVLGNYLPKTQPNFTVGVRTAWTLSSPHVWFKTHRLAGILFMLAGVAGIAGAVVLDRGWLIVSSLAPVLAAALISVVYSWWVWRDAPDKAVG